MLHSGRGLRRGQNNAAELGVKVIEGVSLDWKASSERREKVSRDAHRRRHRCSSRRTRSTLIEGEGSLTDDGNVKVGDETYETKNVDPRHRLGRAADSRRRVRRPGPRHLGRLVAPGAAEDARRRRRRRLRLGDRLRLRPLRHRGDADRDARPDPARRGQGHAPASSSAPSRSRASTIATGTKVEGVEARGQVGQVQARRHRGRGRLPGDRRRPRPRRRGARTSTRPGSRPTRDGKIEIDECQRTSNAKVYAIGDLVRGAGARPQGFRGGRRRGRDDRRRRRPTRSTSTWSPARPSATRRWRASA